MAEGSQHQLQGEAQAASQQLGTVFGVSRRSGLALAAVPRTGASTGSRQKKLLGPVWMRNRCREQVQKVGIGMQAQTVPAGSQDSSAGAWNRRGDAELA